jgi:PAS domain S-box-containing protein
MSISVSGKANQTIGGVKNFIRPAKPVDYLVAIGFALVSVGIRALIEPVAAGVAYLIIALPAVFFAGIYCGILPGLLASILDAVAFEVLFLHGVIFETPPLSHQQLDLLLYFPACGLMLGAAHFLRNAIMEVAIGEDRLREVFRQIPGAAAILQAPDGKLLLHSDHSDEILGHSPSEFKSFQTLADYHGFHDDGRPYAPEEYPIVRALQTGEIVNAEKLRYSHPNGHTMVLEVYAGPVRAPDGKIIASVGTAFDITRRVEAERRLRESEELYKTTSARLRVAIEAGGLGMWEMDLATKRSRWDEKMTAMLDLGPGPTEIDYADAARFFEPGNRDEARKVFAQAMAEGGDYGVEVRGRTAKGEERWFVIRGKALPEEDIAIGVLRDVTNRKRREAALHEALETRALLIREADHRIKNSLQLVISLLRLQGNSISDPDAKEALSVAITRVNAVADAHFALQQSTDLRTIAVGPMIEELCTRFATLNPAITISCDVDTGIALDANQAISLGLILSEILTNALRHGFDPGTAGTIAVEGREIENALELQIADSGKGFSMTTERKGLGSTIIRSLCAQMEARMEMESQPQTGTRIRLSVPLLSLDEEWDEMARSSVDD